MKRFELGFKNHETHNELIYMNIGENTYTPDMLTDDTVALLTALSYVDENDMYVLETYENLSAMIGYETVINGLNKLHELGHDLIPYYQLRRMIMNMYKSKYKGMMR